MFPPYFHGLSHSLQKQSTQNRGKVFFFTVRRSQTLSTTTKHWLLIYSQNYLPNHSQLLIQSKVQKAQQGIITDRKIIQVSVNGPKPPQSIHLSLCSCSFSIWNQKPSSRIWFSVTWVLIFGSTRWDFELGWGSWCSSRFVSQWNPSASEAAIWL